MKIPTKDTEGRENGYLVPVWSELENPELRPSQVYLTTIAPHSRKGPHCHHVRRGFFTVLSGSVTVLKRGERGEHSITRLNLTVGEKTIVKAGTPCALYNYGDTEALVLNLPSPAWSKENPDDHPVENWVDPSDWPNTPVVRLWRGDIDMGTMSRESADLYRSAHTGYGFTEVIRLTPVIEKHDFDSMDCPIHKAGNCLIDWDGNGK